jgi:predicted house-cleaning noncanonical NTP pyrophosphatase (MazG superfamily)
MQLHTLRHNILSLKFSPDLEQKLLDKIATFDQDISPEQLTDYQNFLQTCLQENASAHQELETIEHNLLSFQDNFANILEQDLLVQLELDQKTMNELESLVNQGKDLFTPPPTLTPQAPVHSAA